MFLKVMEKHSKPFLLQLLFLIRIDPHTVGGCLLQHRSPTLRIMPASLPAQLRNELQMCIRDGPYSPSMISGVSPGSSSRVIS